MELKRAFKLTAVGRVPMDWDVVPLSELFDFRNGVNADASAYGTGVPFINVLEVITHSHLDLAHVPGRVRLSPTTVESYRVRCGDILFNRTSETQEEVGLSSVYMSQDEVVFGGFVIRGRLKNVASLNPAYAGYAFRVQALRSEIIRRGQGAIRANIGQSDLKQVLAVLPPLAEQEAIAQTLRDFDSLLGRLTRLLAKKRDLKQAAAQQLLTGRKRLPGFRGDWGPRPLGAVAPLQRGFDLPTSRLRPGDHPVVYSNGVMKHHCSFMVRGPGVVTGRSGTIGKVHFVEADFWPHNTSLWVTDFKDNDPKFVYYLLSSARLGKLGTGSGVPTLNRNDVHSLTLPFPPSKQEQTAIAAVLSDMDAEIAALEARLEKTRLLKQGMMQELLTGRTRLV